MESSVLRVELVPMLRDNYGYLSTWVALRACLHA